MNCSSFREKESRATENKQRTPERKVGTYEIPKREGFINIVAGKVNDYTCLLNSSY